ncbi:transcription elongation factor GreA [Halioglobus japonicus]|uniref:Transcription elongation factor GreA n=1 Tax=Halioglobus japonicus TaxID=930805 RepID=A0AAP8MBI2_9GAMM|nr:transcription elongation factor GreA [Halioglobus japonicus]AQA19960.1 transcription elongation factor GreA [Halioglobus japonicus]PLW84577.1 transcription elongation factor GreA [Halioglobus japonicus]GHD22978.1 transcription elongation factor GreA [Halioglobus japonicus]
MNNVPMTVAGEAALREELEHLKKVERPRISDAIAEAREHGDLKENAEYHAAREQQSFTEGRIMEIEGKLAGAQVIDVTQIAKTGKVIFGTTVSLINIETDEELSYKIVGEDEADVKNNLISIGSPIARALIGKEEGDVVVVRAPGGEVEYEIDEVQHI